MRNQRAILAAVGLLAASVLPEASAAQQRPYDPPLPFARPAVAEPNPFSGRLRVDRFGDPLPPNAISRLGTVRLRHDADFIVHLEFHPSGSFIGALDDRGCLRFWDTRTFQEIASPQFEHSLTSFAFSPDGKLLAVGWQADPRPHHYGMSVHSFESGRELYSHQCRRRIRDLAFSTDQRYLTASSSLHDVYVWDTSAFGPPRIVPATGHEFRVSPDGRRVAARSRGEIAIWDTQSAQRLRTIPLDGLYTISGTKCAWCKDGQHLSIVARHEPLTRVEVNTGRVVMTREPSHQAWHPIAMDSTRNWFYNGAGRSIEVIDMNSGNNVGRIPVTEYGTLRGVAVRRDGSIVAAAFDNRIVLWAGLSPRLMTARLTAADYGFRHSNSGPKYYAAGNAVFDLLSGAPVAELEPGAIAGIDASALRVATLDKDNGVTIRQVRLGIDPAKGAVDLYSYPPFGDFEHQVIDLTFLADRHLALVAVARKTFPRPSAIHCLDLERTNQGPQWRISLPSSLERIVQMRLSQEGCLYVVDEDSHSQKSIWLWSNVNEPAGGWKKLSLPAGATVHPPGDRLFGWSFRASFSVAPNHALAAIVRPDEVRHAGRTTEVIWITEVIALKASQESRRIDTSSRGGWCEFSKSGRYFARVGSYPLVYSIDDRSLTDLIPPLNVNVEAAVFSEDDDHLALASEKTVFIVDIPSGEIVNQYNADSSVTRLASPAKGLLVSHHLDSTAIVWPFASKGRR